MRKTTTISSCYILGQRVDYTTYDKATRQVLDMACDGRGGYVCISTVHMVMEGYDDLDFQLMVNGADLVTPDGIPLVWGLKLLGIKNAERVYGPTLMPTICEYAAREGIPVGFYGSSVEVLEQMKSNLLRDYTNLNIVYIYSPPFRLLTDLEDKAIIRDIIASGVRILFVGLGCPKQEHWMATHKNNLPGVVMLGVGAAFDFIAGTKMQAPAWLQKIGLEWLFRLITEPKRLWWRYLYYNPRFVYKFILQLSGLKKYPSSGDIK